jgi:hypothetical protein
LHTAYAQQLIEAGQRYLWDRDVADRRRLLATRQELLKRVLVGNDLFATLAAQEKPECI